MASETVFLENPEPQTDLALDPKVEAHSIKLNRKVNTISDIDARIDTTNNWSVRRLIEKSSESNKIPISLKSIYKDETHFN